MALAFRLYGNFHWPPTPALTDKIAKGVVEIHYAVRLGDPETAPRRAFLRWYPTQNAADPPQPANLPTDHLFNISPENAAALFQDATKEVAIWLDTTNPPASLTKNKSWLVFRGAFLFEQYREPKDQRGATPILDVQWPLVTQCQYKSGTTVHSALGICSTDRPLFYFSFHLPFPVRRTSRDDDKTRAFPFSAVYSLAPVPAALLGIDTLVAGWKKDDALPNLTQPPNTDDTSFPFLGNSAPADKNKQLGKFGLSEYGLGAGNKFALYRRKASVTGRFWPLNRKAVVQDILWPYGITVTDADWLGPTNLGIPDSSLRFASISAGDGGRSHRSALIYRATVTQAASHDTDGDELQGDSRGLRIRLKDELDGRTADGTQFGLADGKTGEDNAKVEGWLATGGTLSTDCELSWEISRDSIWTADRDADWSPQVTIRLHWPEQTDKAGKLTAAVDTDTVFRAGLLAQAAYSFQTVRDALEAGEAGQPHSFLPDLATTADRKWVRFSLHGTPLPARFSDADGTIAWGRRARGDGDQAWRRPGMRLSITDKALLIDGTDETGDEDKFELEVEASKLAFFETDDIKLTLNLTRDKDWPPQSFTDVDNGPAFFASFAVNATASKAWIGRLSSLQFAGTKKGGPDKSGYLRIGGRGTRLGLGDRAPILTYPDGRIAVELSLSIRTARVEPKGVDVARNDRTERPAPLLIPLGPPPTDGADLPGQLWLTATETISPTQDRRLQATLHEDSPETGDRTYVVLSSEPFTIFRFTHRSLYDRGEASNASVADYSGDDRLWQYKRVSEFYHYVLPPQAVGESADKPRRLEIHDLVDDSETPPRPFLYQKDQHNNVIIDNHGKPILDEMRRRAVEFRLTPSAEIWIHPSDVERGYFMPESTSYEIFRQHGEYGVGAALGFLRAEFLYGLAVGIDVSREHSISRGARVAEIEALTGRLTGRPHETDAEAQLAARWNALRSAVARRPERLEVWARDLDSAIDFTPARFTDGAQFALRHTALHRAPVIDQYSADAPESDTDYAAPPKIGGIDPAQVPPEMAFYPRHHPQGLSGGALWPVESLNLFRTLLRAPQSSGGAIEQIALSPIGGDAVQKGEFLGGKVRIISETRNGFVQRQQVEVLGRICAFWHRAKHVVVYERTVNLPPQFAPKQAEDPNQTRSRRPIRRKVREYIELLQPERNYPDFSTAAQRSAGFLERVRFNSRIINVDSAWAHDVGDFGWEIPLWNRLSARERPQVYPMPDIAFVSTCEGDGEKPVVAQECLDPDYLFFFADFSTTTTAESDTWVSRLNLDFPNMPTAQAIAETADQRSSSQPDDHPSGFEQRRPSVSRILPGLRRFTWRLAPAAQKAAINAGRAEKPVYAGLGSASFMRATHAADEAKTLKPDLARLLGSAVSLAAKEEPEAIQALKYWASDGTGGSDDSRKYSNAIMTLREAIEKKDAAQISPALADLAQKWTGLPATLKNDLGKGFDQAKGFLAGSKLGANLLAVENPCDKLKSDAIGVIKRKEMLIRTALHDWTADAERILPELEHPEDEPDPSNTLGGTYPPHTKIKTKAEAVNALLHVGVKYLRPLFDEASRDVGKANEGVEKARAVVLNLEAELDATVDRARQRIDQFVAGYDRDKPWSDQRRKAFHAGLRACASNIESDVTSLIDEARQHFATELNDASQAVGGYLAKALGDIARSRSDALSDIGSLKDILQPYLNDARKALNTLVPASGTGTIDKAITEIDKAITDIDGNAGINAGLKDKANLALNGLKAVAVQAKTVVASGRDSVESAANMADDLLNQAGSTIKAVAGQLGGIVTSLADKARDVVEVAQELSDAGFAAVKDQLLAIWPKVDAELGNLKTAVETTIKPIENELVNLGTLLDFVVEKTTKRVQSAVDEFRADVHTLEGSLNGLIGDIQGALSAVQLALAPQSLLQTAVREYVLRPALEEVLKPLSDGDFQDTQTALKLIRENLFALSDAIEAPIRKLDVKVLGALEQVSSACSAAFDTVDKAKSYLEDLAKDGKAYFDKKVGDLQNVFTGLDSRIRQTLGSAETLAREGEDLIAAVNAFDHSVRGLQNDLARSTETARMYADRVFTAASRLDAGGLMAAPSNILKLYSAVTTAPEIAALKADIDRIRSGYDELSDVVQTTKANALFNRLGDELKALGLSLPFDKIGDRLLPADLPNFDIGKVFRNFGGSKLDNLLKGYKIPSGVGDAVRLTHDFDKKQARAWVQVDIDAPMGGRRSLFSIGVFKADFVDMRLTGQVRLEASKDQDKVTETGFGRIGTVVDLVVGGQSMVRFENFALNFTRESGLKIEFDPKNIRLNPTFQFIQDFLGTLFPNKVGGLQLIKLNGIPVGVQHDFALPPISLNFGTSGVSNISIENHFKLLAFPDFLLSNRFNLSTIERPFIFSIFIIGGAGYIQIEAEYRPFDKELTVTVEAGAGGSASLAFAFGPFVGQVFITLSGTLSYRKVIGKPGGGLSISAVLVICGHVDVAGLVTIGIVLMLRMTYRDDGQVDADGSLTVEIRISKFFKITAHANAKYKMRGGKSETSVSADASVEPTDPKLKANIDKLQSAAKTLDAARK